MNVPFYKSHLISSFLIHRFRLTLFFGNFFPQFFLSLFWFLSVRYVPIEQVLCAIGPGRCGQCAAPAVFCSSGLLLLVKAIPVMEFQEIVIFQWKKNEIVSSDFWHRNLTLKVKFWTFLTPPHYTNSQKSIISFGNY